MNRRVMLVAIAAALFLGLGAATVAWRPWQEKPASRPPVASPVKPPNRTELQLGQNAGEESRTVTFRDDKVRYLEINFKDGARAFVWREGTAADGRSIVSRAEEVLKNRTRLQYEFLIQGDQPVLESITLWRPPTADGQPGAKLLRIEGDRTTFYQENGQAVQATLSVQRDGTKETGYTFTWYEGLVPGKEAKVLEEVYTQAYVSDNDMSDPFNYYGTTRLSYTTKITVAARDNVPSYRQIYMPPADNPYGGGRYYYGGSGGGRFSGRLGAPGRFNPYGQPPQPERPAVLEYTFADSDLTERQFIATVGYSWGYDDGNWQGKWSSTYEVRQMNRNAEVTAVRSLDENLYVYRVVDKTKTPEVTVEFPVGKRLKEEFNPDHLLKCPLTDDMKALREMALQGISGTHLEQILSD